jgi:hypothetical protein
MPTIAVLDGGITIAIYYSDHDPPHFHAMQAEHEILVEIASLAIFARRGQPPAAMVRGVLACAAACQAELALWKAADLDPASGSLHALRLVPLQIKNFRLSNPSWRDIEWIQQTLDGECQQFGTRVILDSERQLVVIGPRART